MTFIAIILTCGGVGYLIDGTKGAVMGTLLGPIGWAISYATRDDS